MSAAERAIDSVRAVNHAILVETNRVLRERVLVHRAAGYSVDAAFQRAIDDFNGVSA